MTLPIVEITHRIEFSSAHRLESPELTPEENAATYGPCYTDHGHNYALEATVRGPVAAKTGMVMNLAHLAEIMHEELWVPMDHKHLNRDVPFLEGIIPTAENVAVVSWERIAPRLKGVEGCRLHKIRLFESRNNIVEYFGPTEL